MNSEKVTIMYFLGGNIVADDIFGVSYEGGEQNTIRVKNGIKFRELLMRLHNVTGIDRKNFKLKLCCRYPTLVTATHQKFCRMRINNDDSVDAMLGVVLQNPLVWAIDLYVEPVSRTDIVEDVPMHVIPTPTSSWNYNENYIQHQEPSNAHQGQLPQYSHHGEWSQYSEHEQWQQYSQQEQFPQQPRSQSAFRDYDVVGPSMGRHDVVHEHISPTSDVGLLSNSKNAVVHYVQHSNFEECNQNDADDESGDELSDENVMREVDDELENEYSELEIDENDNEEGDVGNNVGEEHPQRMHEAMSFFRHPGDEYVSDPVLPPGQIENSVFDPLVDEFSKGLLFDSKRGFMNAVKRYNIKHGREIRVGKTKPTIWEALCRHPETGCAWRIRGSVQKKHGFFQVVTYYGPHTCVTGDLVTNHRQIDARFVADQIQNLVREDPNYKISGIQTLIKRDFQYDLSYFKCWNAKQKAIADIFGDWDKSYALLPKFLDAVIKYNPGSVYRFVTVPLNGNNVKCLLNRVFFTFKPLIDGFVHCRPLVSIDACHLYGRYKGKILVAVTKDGGGQIFPLAFAYVDEESTENWSWFLRHLRLEVVGNRGDVCLISDRHAGILAAVANPYSLWDDAQSHHRYCLRHLRSNFNTKFQNAGLKSQMYMAAIEPEVRVFNQLMENIKLLNREAWQWLEDHPVKKWAMCHDGVF